MILITFLCYTNENDKKIECKVTVKSNKVAVTKITKKNITGNGSNKISNYTG